MSYFATIIFLISLSGLSLVILGLQLALSRLHATASQKMWVMKAGIIIISLAPVIFYLLKITTMPVFTMMIPAKIIDRIQDHNLPMVPFVSHVNLSYYLFVIYCIGFVIMCLRIAISYIQTIRLLSKSVYSVIQEQSVLINRHISSPLCFGILRARIYFPENMSKTMSQREIEISLAHERIHMQHHDPAWKLLSLLVQALLFFAPWSSVLHKQFDLEMELLCDEFSSKKTGASPREYGNLLLTMVCQQPENAMIPHLSNHHLKSRLIAMKSKSISRPLVTMSSMVLLLCSGAVAIAMTSGVSFNKTTFNIVTQLVIDGHVIALPNLTAKENQWVTVTSSDQMRLSDEKQSMSGRQLTLAVMAAHESTASDAIKLNYDLSYQNGSEKMDAKPQWIVLPNQHAAMRWTSNSGHVYVMKVVVTKA